MKKTNAWRTKEVNELFDVILLLENKTAAANFFRDLLTEPELAEFANRWKVVRLLAKNTPYSTIEQQIGMSSTTIARISKWLTNGTGGYRKALSKLNHHHHHTSTSFEEDS